MSDKDLKFVNYAQNIKKVNTFNHKEKISC